MKKVLSIFAVLALLVVSCTPSAQKLEEQRIADSISTADSIALLIQPIDSVLVDSIANLPVIE